MRTIYYIVCLLLLMACSSSSSEEGDNQPPMSEDEQLALALKEDVKVLSTFPEGIATAGNQFITGRAWEDANGENVLTFTFMEEAETAGINMVGLHRGLYIEHYAREASNLEYRLIRKIEDKELSCKAENMLYLIDKSIEVTDLDEDELKEVSFVYTLGCVDSMISYPMKLVLLEKGEQYTMHGAIRYEHELREKYGEQEKYPKSEQKEFDENFSQAPDLFRKFASQLWDKHELK